MLARPKHFVLQLSERTVPADGFSSSQLKIRSANGSELRGVHVEIESPHQVTLESLPYMMILQLLTCKPV